MSVIILITLLYRFYCISSNIANSTDLPTYGMMNITWYNVTTQTPAIDTLQTTLTSSPSTKCLEMLIKDNVAENYFIDKNQIVPLFHDWRYRLMSSQSYIYRDSHGTLSNLYYLEQSGWIIEIFNSDKNISQRIIYQSFITSDELPLSEWRIWKPHGNKYSQLKLYMKCFDAYSATAAKIIPTVTEEYVSYDESSELIDKETLIIISFTFLLIIVLLVCIIAIMVCAACVFSKKHTSDTGHVRLRGNSSNILEEIELQNIRKEKMNDENKGYTAVPLQQPVDRESIHAVIAKEPTVTRGVSVRVESLFDEDSSGNEENENMVVMPGYNPHETVDVYQDTSGDSEQSMERAKFHE